MNILKVIKVVGLTSVLLSPIGLFGQVFSFFEGFQGTPFEPGYNVTSADVFPGDVTFEAVTGTGLSIRIAGGTQSTGSVTADPFGIPGNQSLVISRGGVVNAGIPRAGFKIPEVLGSGTVSYKFLITDRGSTTNQQADLFLGSGNDPVTGSGYSLRVMLIQNGTDRMHLRLTDGSTTFVESGHSIDFDTAIDLKVTFSSDSTYSVFVNESLVSISGKSEFDFIGSTSSINYVQFASANSAATNSRFFIDDLSITGTVIPEGSTTGLLLGAAILSVVLVIRRRAMLCR